jgi:hypothetical protein
MRKQLRVIVLAGLLSVGLVGVLLAQVTKVSPVLVFTCSAGSFASALANTGIFTCSAGVTGTGTSGTVPRWTGTSALGNSSFTDNGTTTTFTSVLGTIVTETTTSRTLGSTDCGKLIRYTNGSAIAVTVPNSLPAGCTIAGMQIGAGQITVSAGSGATFLANPHAYTKSFGVNAVFGISVDTNSGGSAATFTFVGDGA